MIKLRVESLYYQRYSPFETDNIGTLIATRLCCLLLLLRLGEGEEREENVIQEGTATKPRSGGVIFIRGRFTVCSTLSKLFIG